MNKSKSFDIAIKACAIIAVICTLVGAVSFFWTLEWKNGVGKIGYVMPKGVGIIEVICAVAPSILMLLYVFGKNEKIRSNDTIASIIEFLIINNLMVLLHSYYTDVFYFGMSFFRDMPSEYYTPAQQIYSVVFTLAPLITAALLVTTSWLIRRNIHQSKKWAMGVVVTSMVFSLISQISYKLYCIEIPMEEYSDKVVRTVTSYDVAAIFGIIFTAIVLIMAIKPVFEKKKKFKISIEDKLLQLDNVYEKGFISKEEYEEKRKNILESL